MNKKIIITSALMLSLFAGSLTAFAAAPAVTNTALGNTTTSPKVETNVKPVTVKNTVKKGKTVKTKSFKGTTVKKSVRKAGKK